MLHNLEESEELKQDRKQLMAFRREINMIDKQNTYEEIEQSVSDFIATNEELTIGEVEILRRYVEFVKNN